MTARGALGALAGSLLILSSAAHAFLGWPPFRAVLGSAGLDREIIGALAIGWYFGSVSMLVFGAIVLAAAAEAVRGRTVSTTPLWIIAAGYVVFGLTAWLTRDLNPHFLLFVVTGLLVGGFASWRQATPVAR